MLNDLLASEFETIEIESPSIEPEKVHDKPEIEANVSVIVPVFDLINESETVVKPEVEPEVEPEVTPEAVQKIESSDESAIESGDLNADSLRYKC